MQRPRAGMAEAASALIIRPTSAAARKGGALAPPHTMCQSPLACDSERQRLGAAEAEQSVWFVRRLGAIGQSQRAPLVHAHIGRAAGAGSTSMPGGTGEPRWGDVAGDHTRAGRDLRGGGPLAATAAEEEKSQFRRGATWRGVNHPVLS